jgi:hypothetical protein
MSYSTQGASNRQIYDCCAYAQALQQSVDPLQYDLYFGAVENCNKCIDDKAWFKQDREIVDIESELWNITRPLTNCSGYKYNPNCKTGPNCVSTFDPNAPRILSPSLCPIVYNNIPVQTSSGYTVPNPANICLNKNDYRNADDVDTFEQWVEGNKAILGNNSNPENVFMFMNACSNKPLYQGEKEKVNPYMLNNYNSASVGNPVAQGIPFPRMGYNLDEKVPIRPEGLMNDNLRMGELSQQMMYGSNNMNAEMNPQFGEARLQAKRDQQFSEARLQAKRSDPMGMRLPMMSTKGKMSSNSKQLFDSDNESVYDSDGEYSSV